MRLDGVGVWSASLRYGDVGARREAAAELEELGYTALWTPEGAAGDSHFDVLRELLGATSSIVAATGILMIWLQTPAEMGEALAALDADFPGRTLLGLGVSHSVLVDALQPGAYSKPLATMREYLAGLDAAPVPVPVDRRVLAALGPKMLVLARDAAGGAHPYLAGPENTRRAREILGAGPLLLPEQPVLLERDPGRAREIARAHVSGYLELPNYANNLRRLGYEESELADGGSDRLIDDIVAWGDEDAIAARVQEHVDAGADHVCIQVLAPGQRLELPLAEWRTLAAALIPR